MASLKFGRPRGEPRLRESLLPFVLSDAPRLETVASEVMSADLPRQDQRPQTALSSPLKATAPSAENRP